MHFFFQLEELDDWVNPIYLDIGIQHQIQRQFEKDSQIQLPDFFLVCGLFGTLDSQLPGTICRMHGAR